MGNLTTSYVRTFSLLLVGGLVAWLGGAGIVIGGDTELGLVVAVTQFTTAVVYGVVRLLERKWPVFGLLFGSRNAPEYGYDPS